MAEVLCGVHRVTAMVAFKVGWVGDHLSLEAGLDDSLKDRRCGKGTVKGTTKGAARCGAPRITNRQRTAKGALLEGAALKFPPPSFLPLALEDT